MIGRDQRLSAEVRVLPYPIIVEAGGFGRVGELVTRYAPAHRYAVITDSNVGPIYGNGVVAAITGSKLFTVPAGEANKTRETWTFLTDQLIDAGFGRDSTVIALGGGMIGDLAGFVASTFMRGIPVVQLPTTLLSMIDASVGGKTGVDTRAGKNLVGTFHPPRLVLADTQTLVTLPLEELRTGFAEALKCGVIADGHYFGSLVDGLPGLIADRVKMGDGLFEAIVRSIEIKADIVRRDERESGLRKVLNFGHTIGHAIETLSGYEVPHGAAVAIGMVAESAIAERTGIAESGTSGRIAEGVGRAGLPTRAPAGMTPDSIIGATRSDKKVRGGRVEYSLPRRIGEMAGSESGWAVAVEDEIVREVLS
jgi:3-dehydroquinate synthase